MTPSGCPVTSGFPIRRSPDQSLFDSSPRLVAACHVLHRLSTPRHPPRTLSNLTTLMRDCQTAVPTTWFALLPTGPLVRSSIIPALKIPGLDHTAASLQMEQHDPATKTKLEPVVRPQVDLPKKRLTPHQRGIRRRQICVRFFNCQRAKPLDDTGSYPRHRQGRTSYVSISVLCVNISTNFFRRRACPLALQAAAANLRTKAPAAETRPGPHGS